LNIQDSIEEKAQLTITRGLVDSESMGSGVYTQREKRGIRGKGKGRMEIGQQIPSCKYTILYCRFRKDILISYKPAFHRLILRTILKSQRKCLWFSDNSNSKPTIRSEVNDFLKAF
jgi:hypothetical protein